VPYCLSQWLQFVRLYSALLMYNRFCMKKEICDSGGISLKSISGGGGDEIWYATSFRTNESLWMIQIVG